jgi:hypothetical protein
MFVRTFRLISCGFSEGVALILAAFDQPGLRINSDALPIAPVMIVTVSTLDGVTHAPESLQGVSRESRLYINHVG